MKWPAVFPHISFCTTTQSLQLKGNTPIDRPKTALLQDFRGVGLPVVMQCQPALKSNLAAWSWCTWICHMFSFNEISCFLYQKAAQHFLWYFDIFWCILRTRLIFNMTRWHECPGCQLWKIITGQEFISFHILSSMQKLHDQLQFIHISRETAFTLPSSSSKMVVMFNFSSETFRTTDGIFKDEVSLGSAFV